MLKDFSKKYVQLFFLICGVILFYFVVTQYALVLNWLQVILSIASPILMGLVIAYILSPVFNLFQKKIYNSFVTKTLKKEKLYKNSKRISTLITMFIALVAVVGLFSVIIPEIWSTVLVLIDTVPDRVQYDLIPMINAIFEQYPDLAGDLTTWLDTLYASVGDVVNEYVLPQVTSILGTVTEGAVTITRVAINTVVAISVCVYVLYSKDMFLAQFRKLSYALFKPENAKLLIEKVGVAHKIFSGFIVGKIIDSIIIGTICFIFTSIVNMPYALLVSVIVGVTNVIPYFGPFIGAIPSAFLILLVDPMQCFYFLIFILVLQQVDGNIIGPKILGDTTGISSFWVLVSILVGGGLFGFWGMVLGVPTFAVIYYFIKEYAESRLKRKNLSSQTSDYYSDAPKIAIRENKEDE